MTNKKLQALFLIQLKRFYREPAIIFWAFLFPILMCIALGFAFNPKKNKVLTVAYTKGTTVMPKETPFSSLLWKEKTDLDLSYVDGEIFVLDPLNEKEMTKFLWVRVMQLDPKFGEKIKILSKKGSRYIDFLVPGILALSIMNTCLWGTGYGLIELRGKGMLKRLLASPLSKFDFMVSQILFRFLVAGLEMVLIWSILWWIFSIPFLGSFINIMVLFLSGVVCFTGISILMASRTSNTSVGQGLLNAIAFPMLFLSGIFFNYEQYPKWMVSIIKFLPLTLLSDGLRATLITGESLNLLTCFLLNLIGMISIYISIKIFKWF